MLTNFKQNFHLSLQFFTMTFDTAPRAGVLCVPVDLVLTNKENNHEKTIET